MSFNPHPAIKQGATSDEPQPQPMINVSILTLRSNRVRPTSQFKGVSRHRFQSSPCDQTGCDEEILAAAHRFVACFNPHPAIKQGATTRRRRCRSATACFNPHPAIKQGATFSSVTCYNCAHGFNPHPAIKQGATGDGSNPAGLLTKFQSSPCDQTGCDDTAIRQYRLRYLFQSSPCDQTGRDMGRSGASSRITSFNPHPAIKQGATQVFPRGILCVCCFNPHPAIKQGATCRAARFRSSCYSVSILTLRSNRVRPKQVDIAEYRLLFQSSPCDQTGCDPRIITCPVTVFGFQSSPCDQTGCDRLSR